MEARSLRKVCTIGGGTGNFVILRGLKRYPLDLSAIVSMSDDGGSTGVLRDELGVLPAGDTRQCVVALSNSSRLMRNLMNYRFETGGLMGHSFGNIFLSSLEKVTGSFERAIEEVGKILNMRGKVIPVTTEQVRLKMTLTDGEVLEGEKAIYLSQKIDEGYKDISLIPGVYANSHAIDEIFNADAVIIGPGGYYTSIIANLLVDGIPEAIRETDAIKIFVVNLMNRKGQTTGFALSDYLRGLEKYLGEGIFDYVLVNNQQPPDELIEMYREEGELVQCDVEGPNIISAPMLGEMKEKSKGDLLERSLIRHDSKRLAQELMKILARVDGHCYSSLT